MTDAGVQENAVIALILEPPVLPNYALFFPSSSAFSSFGTRLFIPCVKESKERKNAAAKLQTHGGVKITLNLCYGLSV